MNYPADAVALAAVLGAKGHADVPRRVCQLYDSARTLHRIYERACNGPLSKRDKLKEESPLNLTVSPSPAAMYAAAYAAAYAA